MFQGRRRKERRPISLSGLFSVFFFWGGGVWASGSSLWASDFRYSLAHCLVSKKVSVEHWEGYIVEQLPGSSQIQSWLCCLLMHSDKQPIWRSHLCHHEKLFGTVLSICDFRLCACN